RSRSSSLSPTLRALPDPTLFPYTTLFRSDPRDIAGSNPDRFRNRAVTDVYEPGSVNKVITASAALETGVLSTSRQLTISDGYTLYGKTFTDAHPHPTEQMTLGDILAYSSNVGAITVA